MQAQRWHERGAQFELVVKGHGTHFDDATTRVFLKRDNHLISATQIRSEDADVLSCLVTLPTEVPAASFDVYVNGKVDGTISYANGFFATGLDVVEGAPLNRDEGALDNLQKAIWAFTSPFNRTSWKAFGT